MGVGTWLASKLDPGRDDRAVRAAIHARDSTEPIAIQPFADPNFGPGVGNQPRTEDLLREAKGTFDSASKARADRVASLNLRAVVLDSDGKEEVLDMGHPANRLIKKPHPDISASTMHRTLTLWLDAVGEGFLLKVGSGLKIPVELHFLPPTNVERIWSHGVVSHYIITDGNGQRKTKEKEVVIDFYYPDPERPWGSEGVLGPQGTNADALKFANLQQREFFRKNSTPPLVVKVGGEMPDNATKNAFNDAWRNKMHRITGKDRGGPMLLPADYDVIQLAIQNGADVVPLLQHFRDDLLMSLRTPRAMLGQVVAGDRSSAEVMDFTFDKQAILPITTLIENVYTDQLAIDFDPRIMYRYEDFVAQDKEFNLRKEDQDLRNLKASINMILEKAGEPAVPWGENPVSTFNQVPYTGVGFDDDLPDDDPDALGDRERERTDPKAGPHILAETSPAPKQDEPTTRATHEQLARAEWDRQIQREKQFVPRFSRAMRDVFATQKKLVLARLNKLDSLVGTTAEELLQSADGRTQYVAVQRVRVDAFTEIGQETMAELLRQRDHLDFVFTQEQAAALERQGAQLIQHADATTRSLISKQLQEATLAGESVDQMAARITRVFSTRRKQAQTIARTEILKSSQEAQLSSFEQSGVVEKKQWNHSLDTSNPDHRPSHFAIDGDVVGVRDSFLIPAGELPAERASAPGVGADGNALSAGNSVSCRCFLTPVRLDA